MSAQFYADFLSYSGGTGSSALLWMVITGFIPRPEHFYVLNADPGMEDYRSYEYVNMMESICQKLDIEFIRVESGNLYLDLTDPMRRAALGNRCDNPPLWTIDPKTGKMGRLKQKCTGRYKIQPMDRAARVILERDFGITRKSKRLPEGCARRWIGFSHCEWHRVSESDRKYIQFRHPLIELKLDKKDILHWYLKNGVPVPPRSVCIGCYANDVDYFREMHDQRPGDFERACIFDDAIRDMKQFGIRDICFVSSTCIPLRELAIKGFAATDQDNIAGCYSGHCFV